MAYVGTARSLGNDQNTLRSVVLGEASGQGLQGETAVADVIYNRAALNQAYPGTFPGDGTAVGVATAPHQFQGQVDLSNYSPAQIAQADQAISNAQNGIDPTGGATYYANPGASTASWATNLNSDNSVKIGSHYFTDNTDGLTFKGNPTVDGSGNPPADQPPSTDTQPVTDPTSDGGTIVTTDQTAPDGTSTVPADPNASNPIGSLMSMLGLGGGSGPTKANPSSTPTAIATGADETAAASTANTKTAVTTATSIYGLIFAGLGDTAGRVAFVVIGLVLLAGGLWIIASEEGAVPGPAEVASRVRRVGATVLA